MDLLFGFLMVLAIAHIMAFWAAGVVGAFVWATEHASPRPPWQRALVVYLALILPPIAVTLGLWVMTRLLRPLLRRV